MQLLTLDFVNWKMDSVIEKLKNQFNEFLMEASRRRNSTVRCVSRVWPDDRCCPRRQRLQSISRST